MTKNFIKIFIFSIIFIIGTYFYTRSSIYPNLFAVYDITAKIKTDVKQDFSGAVLINLDEDPDNEIFIAGHGSSNLFLKSVKDELIPIKIPELEDSKGLSFSVTACDLDYDGRDELLVINHSPLENSESQSKVFKYSNGKWENLLTASDPITSILNKGFSSTCIDRKGDGRYGVAVASENGKIAYIEMQNSKFVDIASEIGLGLSSKGRSILGVPGPLGFTNIFVGNEGPNFYFKNNGAGFFTEVAEKVGLSDPFLNARGISLIDHNNDEIIDIVYGNDKGPTRLYEQTRDGKFIEVTPEIMKRTYAVNSAVVGDFNLDGFEDLYLNNIRGHNKIFSHFKDKWFELDREIFEEKELFGISTIAGDLNHDGSYDILNTHGDKILSPITLYTIKPEGEWIKFSANYQSGTIPRGMTIILRTNKRVQVRAISSGSGRFANYDQEVIFGLLKDESAQSVEVILPSGKRVEYGGKLVQSKTNHMIIP